MGAVCEYLEGMKAVEMADFSNYEKLWLKHYGNMLPNLDYHQGSIYDMFRDSAEKYPDYLAMEYFNTTFTYKQLLYMVDKTARALKGLGIVPDESVTICMPNIPEAIFLIYGINKIGAVCNVIHPLSDHNDIAYAMESTDSSVIFTTDASYGNVKGVKGTVIVCEVSKSMPTLLRTAYNIKSRKAMKYEKSAVKWKDFIEKRVSGDVGVTRTKNHPAIIIYSGGTTGKSKGIVLSNLCFNALSTQCYAVCREARAGNSILSALPIFHGFGLCVSIHVPLTLGLKCILIPKIDVSKLNETIYKKKPNLLPAIPTMLNAMTNNSVPAPDCLKSVKVILSGGDYLSDEVRGKVLGFFKNNGSDAHIQVGYGLSEATAFIAATSETIKQTDNLGLPNPDTLIKICDPETNRELPYGEVGEICVNGPTVMMGYINEPEETENALRTHGDGATWLHTGDLGFIDSEGILHFTSRLKRMIISNGYNIYPTELENIVNKCKYVASSVVVGVKDKVRQEAPKVVVVLKKGVKRTAEVEKEVAEFCKKHIARNAQPKEIEYTDALPTTKIGKINYRKFEEKQDDQSE